MTEEVFESTCVSLASGSLIRILTILFGDRFAVSLRLLLPAVQKDKDLANGYALDY